MKRITLLLAFALAAPVARAEQAPVTVTQIGWPSWEPVDFHLFTAPIGTFNDGFAEFNQTVGRILPLPFHVTVPPLALIPGTAHPPPYTNELASGLSQAGFRQATMFTSAEFSFPNGVWLTFMNVPRTNAPTGSSPDFASGPIVPNTDCPIHISGVTTRNGVFFDDDFDADTFALGDLFNVDGWSHFPNFAAEAREFNTDPAPGFYHFETTQVDPNGNGWHITTDYQVSDHDLAITSIKATKTVTLTSTKTNQTKFVTVTVQNRGPDAETITNLADLVTLQVQSLKINCPDLPATLLTVPPQRTLPFVLKSKASVKVFFSVRYATDCVPDPFKSTKTTPHGDYRYLASLNTATGIDGLADIHTADDVCPRAPLGADNHAGKTILDKGCGSKTPSHILGGDVITDLFVH